MLGSPKLLIVVGLAGLGLFLLLIFSFPRAVPPEKPAIAGGSLPAVSEPGFKPPASAFVPAPGGAEGFSGPELGPFPAPSGVGSDAPGSAFLSPPSSPKPKFEVNIPSLEEVGRTLGNLMTPSLLPSADRQKDLIIELPEVPETTLKVVPNGPSEPIVYVENFAVGAFKNITFDGKKFENVLKGENNLPLLPQQLVEKGIAEKNFTQLKNSLLVFREYMLAKENFVKSLEVSTKTIDIAKEIIGFDMLMLELIDKAIAVADGKESITSIEEFYKKFEATSDLHRDRFLRQFGIVSYKPSPLFEKLAKFLGVGEIAYAQLPFGTFIGKPIFCTCSISFWIPTGPPVPAPVGALNASLAWISSPAFFPFKSLRQGAAWLGLYSGVSPCLQFVGAGFFVGCAPIPPAHVGNIPLIAGTSI